GRRRADRRAARRDAEPALPGSRGHLAEQPALPDAAFADQEHAAWLANRGEPHDAAQSVELDLSPDQDGRRPQASGCLHGVKSDRLLPVVPRIPLGDDAGNNSRSMPKRAADRGGTMSFENVMATTGRWAVATEALAAVGAELTLAQAGAAGESSAGTQPGH